MGKKDVLALDTRRNIFEFIRRRPGTHLRGIARMVDMPFGQVLYHLDYLERAGLVVVRKDGGFKRYFVKNEIGRRDKDYISALRHDVPRHVAVLLLLSRSLSHGQMLAHLSVSGSTLSFHLNKMVETGILARLEEGNENYYSLTDEQTASRTLVLYRESFADVVVDRFVEYWLTVNYRSAPERAERLHEVAQVLPRLKGEPTPSAVAAEILRPDREIGVPHEPSAPGHGSRA